jgi:hypothetical protein
VGTSTAVAELVTWLASELVVPSGATHNTEIIIMTAIKFMIQNLLHEIAQQLAADRLKKVPLGG